MASLALLCNPGHGVGRREYQTMPNAGKTEDSRSKPYSCFEKESIIFMIINIMQLSFLINEIYYKK